MTKACSLPNGGVVFISNDELERKPNSISYKEFLEQEDAKEKVGVFGKRKAPAKTEGSEVA